MVVVAAAAAAGRRWRRRWRRLGAGARGHVPVDNVAIVRDADVGAVLRRARRFVRFVVGFVGVVAIWLGGVGAVAIRRRQHVVVAFAATVERHLANIMTPR